MRHVFVLIGVGASNMGARTAIRAFGDKKIEMVYIGNSLSPSALSKALDELTGKSVYVNVIAKDFTTIEPGATFRVVRNYLENTYGQKEAAKRIIATGSPGGSKLEKLGEEKGYTFFQYPLNVGGKFSVLSAVGLLPMAVAGVDIRSLLYGAEDMRQIVTTAAPENNMAVQYALYRNILLEEGYLIEILAYFEPMLSNFSKWWVQLFGENKGSDGKGLFPVACSFSEDLHTRGQYIQMGKGLIFETFLNVVDPKCSVMVPHENNDKDGFQYIDGVDFKVLNKTICQATLNAHESCGIPLMIIDLPDLSPYYMGQLIYFFMHSCYLSGSMHGVSFVKNGRDIYKLRMFEALGKL